MIRRAVLLMMLHLIAAPAAWAASPPVTVTVHPFELYNVSELESLAPGLQSMLASRLEGEGYQVRTPAEAGDTESDWAVNTTITRLGKVISVDASLVPVTASQAGARTYETVDGADELLPALERVAERLKQTLAAGLTLRPPPPPPAPAAVAPDLLPPGPPAPVPVPAPAAVPSQTPGAAPVADLTTLLSRQRSSPEVSGAARGVVVTDVDADGAAEVVLLLDERLEGYRDDGSQITRIWEVPLSGMDTPLTLSAADVDGNGRPELFVAGQDGAHPVTQAYEWTGSNLAPKGGRTAAFLRAVSHPQQGPLLLGRVSAVGKDLFRGDTRRFHWKEGSYQAGDKADLPSTAKGVNLNYLQTQSGGPVYTVVTTQDDELQIHDPGGRLVHEVDETVKGTVNKLRGEEKTVGLMDEDIVYISGSSVAWVGPDGTAYLLVYKNTGGVGRLFKRLTTFSNSHLLAYRWDGLGMAKAGQSPSYTGYVPDLALRSAGVGTAGATLYAALVREEGLVNQVSWSRLLAWDLP